MWASINAIFLCLCLLTTLQAEAQPLSDKAAGKETQTLYKNLHKLSQKHIIFGHQDDLAYGVNWKYMPGKSDIKEVVNDYPGVYGWDLGRIEHASLRNIDGIPFSKMREYIQDGYEKGAVITLSWHFDNPLTGGSSWDTTRNSVASILPGGAKHQLYISWLNKAAKFIFSLKGSKGEPIPILFRPFHEISGNWFWWGRNVASPAEIKKAWRFTVDYLNNNRKLHNLIFVYNTNGVASEQEFLKYYPGDDVVDVLSFDLYQFKNQDKSTFTTAVQNNLAILSKIAKERGKLSAFAETGYEAIPDANWWTGTLWPAIKDYPLSYVLVWRNAGYMPSMKKMHYYAPFEGQVSAPDFKQFYQNKRMLFEKALGTKKIYDTN